MVNIGLFFLCLCFYFLYLHWLNQVQHSSIILPTCIIWLIADQSGCVQQTVDFHCRRTLSLYHSTRSTSVQGDHFHSVYFAAGTASASLPRQGVCRRCPQRTVLVGLP